VNAGSGAEFDRRLGVLGYRAFRIGRRRLEPGLEGGRGLFNALFLPEAARQGAE
jgi:hypothetical protein